MTIAVAFCIVILISQYIIFKNRSNMHKRELAIKDARIQGMQSNISPHFLNNALEIMNWQARLGNTDEVSNLIEALSKVLDTWLYRGAMPGCTAEPFPKGMAGFDCTQLSEKEDNYMLPLWQELEAADAYLYIVGCRYGERLKFIKNVEAGLLDVAVPGLILQPLIDNALKHDTESDFHAVIEVNVYGKEGHLYIDIINNGKAAGKMRI